MIDSEIREGIRDWIERVENLQEPQEYLELFTELCRIASRMDWVILERWLEEPADSSNLGFALLVLATVQPCTRWAQSIHILTQVESAATSAAAFYLVAHFPDDNRLAEELLLGPDAFSPPRLKREAHLWVVEFMGLSGERRFRPWLERLVRHRFHYCSAYQANRALLHLGSPLVSTEIYLQRSISVTASGSRIVITDDEKFGGGISNCIHCRYFPCRINRYHYGAIEDCKLWNRTDPADLLEIRDLRSWRAEVPLALRGPDPREEIRAARMQMEEGLLSSALPRLSAVLAEGGESVADAWHDLARCLEGIGCDDLGRWAETAPSSAEERREVLSLAQYSLGCRLEDEHRYEEAAAAFRSALVLADSADDKVAYAGRAAGALADAGDKQGAYRLLLLLESEVTEAEDPDCLAVWAANFLKLHHELGGKEEPAVLRAVRPKLPAELLGLPRLGRLPPPETLPEPLILLERMLAETEPDDVEHRHDLLLQLAKLQFSVTRDAGGKARLRLAEAEALEDLLAAGSRQGTERRIVAARFLTQEDQADRACSLFAEISPLIPEEAVEKRLEVAGYHLEALGRSATPRSARLAGSLVDTVIHLYDELLLAQPGSAARRQMRETHQRVFEAALLALLSLAAAAGNESAAGQDLLFRAWRLVLASRNPELQRVPTSPAEEQARHLQGLEDSLHRALWHDYIGGSVSAMWPSFLEKVTAYEISAVRTGRSPTEEAPGPPERGVAVAFFQFRELVGTRELLALIAHQGRFRPHLIPHAADRIVAPLAAWARWLRGPVEGELRAAKQRSTLMEMMEMDGAVDSGDREAREATTALLPHDLPGLGATPAPVSWYLFPDAELHTLPLEVLPDPVSGEGCLGQHLSLRFCLRPSVPAGGAEPIDFSRGWLGLGGAPAVARYGYLAGTKEEVYSLGSELASRGYPAEALLGDEAHADRLLERLAALRPSVLHLAVHGQAHPEHPPDTCALIFAPSPGSAEKELLPFRRIRDLPLAGVQLVVLSACSSLIGPSGKSAGIEGLAWAFLQAGATQVIASRYPVDDEATCTLMRMLYRHLLDHPVAEALRRMREQAEREGIRRREIGAWAVWS